MNELLDYSSWSFQLVFFLVVIYLVVGLIQPKWVLAAKRSTIVIVLVLPVDCLNSLLHCDPAIGFRARRHHSDQHRA